MFKNQIASRYYILFLLFCVTSSKGIIIYNEETLVALCFFLFVVFSLSYFGNTIKESLDERSSQIQLQDENFHKLKSEALQELLCLHKLLSLDCKKAFPSIKKDTDKQLSSMGFGARQGKQGETLSSIQLYNNFCEPIKSVVSSFQSSKALLQQRLQKSISLMIKLHYFCKIQNTKSN